MSDIVKELQDIREWFVHKNMNMMACTIDEAVTSIKYGEQQARILQSSWDACVNSRANLQSKITTLERQLAKYDWKAVSERLTEAEYEILISAVHKAAWRYEHNGNSLSDEYGAIIRSLIKKVEQRINPPSEEV